MKYIFVLFFCFHCFSSYADDMCANNKHVVEECYNVRGKLIVHANMRLYLHTEGKRLLAVYYYPDVPEPELALPKNVSEMLEANKQLSGDYKVCPFTPQAPGKMQIVCINSAKNLIQSHNQ